MALMGNSHANTFEGIPGLAELEGAIGVRIADSAPGTSRGLRQDIGAVVASDHKHPHYRFLKNDYWLQVDIPGTKPKPPALSPMLIAPRVGWKRRPTSVAAAIVSSSRAPLG